MVVAFILIAVLVVYKTGLDKQVPSATAPQVAPKSAVSEAQAAGYSPTDIEGRRAGSLPEVSKRVSRPLDAVLAQPQMDLSDSERTQQYRSAAPLPDPAALDPAEVAADMSGSGSAVAMIRPPSGGPSIVDAGLPGPDSAALRPDQAESTAVIAAPEMSQPVGNTATPTSVGPGPSETDLRLPGPGESAE